MLKSLSLLLFLNIFCQPAFAQSQRLIHSGFEPNVSITDDLNDIAGVDQSTGYDWSSNPSWIKSSGFVYLLSRTLDTSQYQNSSIITAPGPRGNSTKVLKLDNLKDDPANQYVSRNEFSLFAYKDGDGPEYTEGYSRYWMRISDLTPRVPLAEKAPWFLMMEWKEGDTGVSKNAQECEACCGFRAGSTNNYRIGIYIDKARGESEYRWRLQGQQNQPCNNTEWRYTNTTAEVLFDEWILVEAYMRKHATDGRVAFAVNGEIILDTDLTAPEGFTGRTQHKDNPIPLKFWSPLKNYIDTLWYERGGPISLLYDDLEIWESIPNDASFAQRDPSGSSPGIWLEAESGTVGANWEVLSDEKAANGSFVQPIAGFNSREEAPTGVADRVRYRFNVPEAGTYHVWGRVITPTNGDDSFWVRFNSDAWSPWYVGQRENWSWVKQGEVTLAAGQAALDIAYREDGAQLDKLYLTQQSTHPAGVGPVGNADCDATPTFPDPEQWFYLENKAYAGNGQPERLDTDNCTSVDVDPGTAQDKQWRFALTDDGSSYYLINRVCGSYLDADNCQTVDLHAPATGDDKRWTLTLSDDGVHYLLNNKACGGKNLDTDNCGNVKVAGGNQNDKRWKLVEAGSVNAREGVVADKEVWEENIPEEGLQVYPNPVRGRLRVNLPSDEPAELLIHDAVGRIVQQQPLQQSNLIDVSGLPQGIYLVKVRQGGGVQTKRILIE